VGERCEWQLVKLGNLKWNTTSWLQWCSNDQWNRK